MMQNNPFDSEYVKDASTTAPETKSATKQFLKEPVGLQELKRYGTSKPSRVIMRAKLIHGKG